jgi:hypothetical protein
MRRDLHLLLDDSFERFPILDDGQFPKYGGYIDVGMVEVEEHCFCRYVEFIAFGGFVGMGFSVGCFGGACELRGAVFVVIIEERFPFVV